MDAGLRLPRGQCRAFLGEMPNRPLLHAAWDTGGRLWSLAWGLVQPRGGVLGEGENRLPSRGGKSN